MALSNFFPSCSSDFFIISTINSINASTDSHLQISSSSVSTDPILRTYAPPPNFTVCSRRDLFTTLALWPATPRERWQDNGNGSVRTRLRESSRPAKPVMGDKQASYEDVETKPSVRGHDPSLTAKLEGVLLGTLI
ncbi:hypothetical protein JMJ78_0008170 [Colletotrichum scovillei]|nr:hypothetical protein JMJ78_0008170 [Colletotrichum scovillei]